ncbi:hypothetical protein [Aquisediminimonas profunda]|uniref:hypothetical protein n=1 Tax=Aquisediminimonas profunda TaxID=1550733 RepID=UPI001C62A692|nr:hypothetical protein [Aquisediminimonas profunda]
MISGSILWLTGGAWLYFHYFGQVEGEFGPEVHPLEPWLMRLHGLALIPALMGVGGLLVAHIPKGWNDVPQRNIGLVLSTLLGLMILSGYLLYYVGNDFARSLTSLAHWSVGLASPAFFLWHYRRGKSTKAKGTRKHRSGRADKRPH